MHRMFLGGLYFIGICSSLYAGLTSKFKLNPNLNWDGAFFIKTALILPNESTQMVLSSYDLQKQEGIVQENLGGCINSGFHHDNEFLLY